MTTMEFTTNRGEPPSASGDESEKALAHWVSTQRSSHRRAALPAIQVTLMNMIPGWDERTPRTDLEDHWRERFSQLQGVVTEAGVLPHYKRHASEHERVLGVWLHTQHQARAEGRLLPRREEALDEALPGWRSSM